MREESYAGRLAGEARAFRHPPSPLQEEVNRVIVACIYAMVPLAILLILTLKLRNTGIDEAAQTATAGLVTLIPEGLVLLMSVTFAVAAVRLAKKDTLVQQMSATESLAAVDTICVDKTGTLTDGELRLLGAEVAEGVEPAAAHAALGNFAASAGDRNRTLETIAERFPGRGGEGRGRGAVLLGVEVERRCATSARPSYVLGAPDVLGEAGALTLPPGLAAGARARDRGGPARRRLRRDAASRCRPIPAQRAGAATGGAWRWSCWRRRCAPTRPRRSPSCASRKST